MSPQASDRAARDAARDALISSVIVYGMQAALILGVTAAMSRRYWLEAARWRLEQWRTRGEREYQGALAEVRRDISRLEHGEAMPGGGTTEPGGLYGGLR